MAATGKRQSSDPLAKERRLVAEFGQGTVSDFAPGDVVKTSVNGVEYTITTAHTPSKEGWLAISTARGKWSVDPAKIVHSAAIPQPEPKPKAQKEGDRQEAGEETAGEAEEGTPSPEDLGHLETKEQASEQLQQLLSQR